MGVREEIKENTERYLAAIEALPDAASLVDYGVITKALMRTAINLVLHNFDKRIEEADMEKASEKLTSGVNHYAQTYGIQVTLKWLDEQDAGA